MKMKGNNESSMWPYILLAITASAGIGYYLYHKFCQEKRNAEEQYRIKLMNDIKKFMDECWCCYTELNSMKYLYGMYRDIICDNGFIYYYHRLLRLLSRQLDEESTASRIKSIISGNLRNLLNAKLKEVDGTFVIPNAPEPDMTRNAYMFNMGIDVNNLKPDENMLSTLKAEDERLHGEINNLKKNKNAEYYKSIFTKLLPVVSNFVNDSSDESKSTNEIIALANEYKESVEHILNQHDITFIPYDKATPEQKEKYFIQAESSNTGTAPAVIRNSDCILYYKGIYLI